MELKDMLYEGKAKQVFLTEDPERVVVRYKDTATAFNNIKKATIVGKGKVTSAISALLYDFLSKAGVKTHFEELLDECDQVCRRVKVIPLEVVVRNTIAGSMAQRLGLEEGTKPENVIYDLFYKSDELGDPLMNDHHAVAMKLATYEELQVIYALAGRINSLLLDLFRRRSSWPTSFRPTPAVCGTSRRVRNSTRIASVAIWVMCARPMRRSCIACKK